MLTDKQIQALKPLGKRYERADAQGLYIEVHPSGHKAWRYRYRLGERREKLTIGSYPEIGIRDARIARAEAEKTLIAGSSPVAMAKNEKSGLSALRTADTFKTVAEQWLEIAHKPANKNPGQDETYLRRDILPKLGAMKLADIEITDVWGCVDPVRKRGHLQAALRVRNVIKRIFDFAVRNGFKGRNPAEGLEAKSVAPKSQRVRVLSFDEIPQWLEELKTSSMSRAMKLALQALILIPGRKSELLLAPWSEFDLDAALWTVPSERSKTAAKIRHKLPHQLIAILRELKVMGGDRRWVFASNRGFGKKPVSKSGINAALRSMSHTLEHFTIHDLRRTVRTGMSEIGIPQDIAERCLNHKVQGIAGVYDLSERLAQRGDALQQWADHVDKLVREYSAKNRLDSITTTGQRQEASRS